MKYWLSALTAASILMGLTGCGVRGNPEPPLTPTELGRGQPTFKRTGDEYTFPDVPPPGTRATPKPSEPTTHQ